MLTQNNGRKMPIFVTPCILPSHTGFKNIFIQTDVCNIIINGKTDDKLFWLLDYLFLYAVSTSPFSWCEIQMMILQSQLALWVSQINSTVVPFNLGKIRKLLGLWTRKGEFIVQWGAIVQLRDTYLASHLQAWAKQENIGWNPFCIWMSYLTKWINYYIMFIL